MFPTSFEGTIEMRALESTEVDLVLNQIEQALKAERATAISRTGNTVSFRAGLFRLVMRENVLAQVGKGEIEVLPGSPGTVKYRFSSVQMLLITTLMAGFMGIVARSPVGFAVTWLWLFGMNYLIGAFRLPRFVRKAVGA